MGQPPPVVLLQVTPIVHASRTHLSIRMKQGITETEKGLAEIFTASLEKS